MGVPHGHHPNSRANLSPFRKGHDPRRAVGAPSLGREFTADLNELGRKDDNGDAVYPVSELERIIESPKSAHSKVAAAQEILRMRLAGYDKMERIPKAANSIDRIMDRTDGKPKQTLVIERENTAGELETMQARLRELLLDPRLPALVELYKREQAEQAPVDAEAKVLPAGEDAAALAAERARDEQEARRAAAGAPKGDVEPILLSPQDGLKIPPKPMPPVRSRRPYVPPLSAG